MVKHSEEAGVDGDDERWDETKPLLQIQKTSHLQESTSDSPVPYSKTRVRLVTSLVIMLVMVSIIPGTSLVSQYLVHRLGQEKYLNETSNNESVCERNSSDPKTKQEDELQAQASSLLMYFAYASAFPAIFCGLVLGAYSDYIGRRFTLLVPVFGFTVKFILICCIISFQLDLSVFYAAYAVEGSGGGLFVILMALYTITADSNTGAKDRVLWIVIITCLGNIMTAISSVVTGILINQLGFLAASLLLMSAMALGFILPFVFLPETLPPPQVKELNPLKNIKRVFGFFMFDGTLRQKLTFLTSLLMFFFAVISDLSLGSIDTLYQMREPFCWSSKLIGYYSAFKTGGMYLIGMFLMKMFQYCFRHEYTGMIAALCQGSAYLLEAFAKNTWQLFLVPAIGTPGSLITPVLRAMMSLLAGPNNQGALFTSICVFEIVCSIAANTVFNQVYAATVNTFAGATFLCMSSFSYTTFLLFFVYFCLHDGSSSCSPDRDKRGQD